MSSTFVASTSTSSSSKHDVDAGDAVQRRLLVEHLEALQLGDEVDQRLAEGVALAGREQVDQTRARPPPRARRTAPRPTSSGEARATVGARRR